MDLANEVIKLIPNDELILAKPVVRHGEIPTIVSFETKEEVVKAAEKKIQQLISEG